MKAKIENYINCTCDIGYTSRELVDPDCALCNHIEDIESYAKQHTLQFQKYMNELYGIGGFEEQDEIDYNEWIKPKQP